MSVKRPKIIFGERQPVADLTPEGEPGQLGNRKCLCHLIAEDEAPSGLRGEGAGEALGASLFRLDEAAQARFIIVEGLPISPSGLGEFAAVNSLPDLAPDLGQGCSPLPQSCAPRGS